MIEVGNFYFFWKVAVIDDKPFKCIYYGKLRHTMPKLGFLDKSCDIKDRESIYIFDVKKYDGEVKTEIIYNKNQIYLSKINIESDICFDNSAINNMNFL